MNLETKCPHCDQWTASDVESCSKCGDLLFESDEGANPFISRLKKNWQLVTGLTVAVLILFVLVRKSDLSGQLGFYGQWDEDKDGYLNGREIKAAMTKLNKVEVNARDINGESHLIKFRWEPPRDINLDQRLSREELARGYRGYSLFQKYDLDKDGLLSKAEIEKEPVPDINGNRGKQLLFEPLKKFDLNQDGKLALLEIPPYHSLVVAMPHRARSGRSTSRGSSSRGSSKSSTRYTPEQIAAYRKKREKDARKRNRENDGKRKLPEGSKRVSDYGRYEQTAKRYDTNGDGILDSGERAKWRADYAASRNSQSSGGSKAAGSGGDTGAGGDGDTGAGGGGVSRGGGPSVLPGALVLNDELTRFDAETLQDLVDAGLYDSMEDLQATAPDGAVWGINPDTGLVVPIFP
jgi:hypothetical protein